MELIEKVDGNKCSMYKDETVVLEFKVTDKRNGNQKNECMQPFSTTFSFIASMPLGQWKIEEPVIYVNPGICETYRIDMKVTHIKTQKTEELFTIVNERNVTNKELITAIVESIANMIKTIVACDTIEKFNCTKDNDVFRVKTSVKD